MGIHAQPREIDVPKDNPFKHDLLDRREAVETLTHLVANLDGPCVLAVDAAWGAGKTTFLRIWTQHLRNQGFPVVEFNAWETDYSEEPFVTLSTELTEGFRLGKTKLPGDTAKELKKASLEVLRCVVPRGASDSRRRTFRSSVPRRVTWLRHLQRKDCPVTRRHARRSKGSGAFCTTWPVRCRRQTGTSLS